MRVTECEVVLVLITFPEDGDVASFATCLVDERLAACVNVLPAMESVYRWEGAVARAFHRFQGPERSVAALYWCHIAQPHGAWKTIRGSHDGRTCQFDVDSELSLRGR